MGKRLAQYFHVWRTRGAATMNHRLWLHWAIFGRYPRCFVNSYTPPGED